MSQPQLAATESTTDWITEFDAVDPTYVLSPIRLTLLGRLPTELLELIIQCLARRDVARTARTGQKLRGLCERKLYSNVVVPYSRMNIDNRGQEEEMSELVGGEDTLWPLYNTLHQRPDLAQKIKAMDILATDHTIRIEADLSSALPGGVSFSNNIKFELNEAVMVAALLQILPEVKILTIQLVDTCGHHSTDRYYSDPAMKCVSTMFPGFDPLRSHLSPSAMLKKLTRLEWWGFDFHWVLARFPCLRDLWLMSPVRLIEDGAPDETNPAVTTLKLTFRSWLLDTGHEEHQRLTPFLAHFPSMKSLVICIRNRGARCSRMPTDVSRNNQGSFSHLLTRLDAVAPFLVKLEIEVDLVSVNDIWLGYVTPGAVFQQFRMLRSLKIPYQSLSVPRLSIGLTSCQRQPSSCLPLCSTSRLHTPRLPYTTGCCGFHLAAMDCQT
jgi:hypothetical protein